MKYSQVVDYIHGLGRFGSRPGLSRISAALAHLGNPHEGLNVVHVAGTNGKGSTCSMMASIFRAAGLHTGLYTSPYLDSFTNRFGLDGQDITPDELVAVVEDIRPVAEREGLTQFEFITALAFYYYKSRQIDMLVLEVGLGGRLDATNVVTPLVSAITNIGFDHMEILGNTLGKIAYEKAGIIKPGVPVVTSVDALEALHVIAGIAQAKSAPLRVWGKDFYSRPISGDLNSQTFDYSGWVNLGSLELKLLGPHQVVNAGLAVDVALGLQLSITAGQIRQGLREALWPGRFEIMRTCPWVIMDGAHNSHGALALSRTLDALLPNRKIRLVTGILSDKEPAELLRLLKPHVLQVYACAPSIPRATNATELASIASELGLAAAPYESVAIALQTAVRDASPEDVVLVAGSLYTVSEARVGLAAL
ncbi:MAG: dihydrofolate synthase / folylpolyglutamate synthase [Bacillota bacterium]|nr:MAG: dihydrofolate synthase / folylpolyglutamate synthase [Bacillota bacterium]MBS3949515.1 bifunctional folylpolyglutamate synthase/dihydrofolate synthase [Peptococcaceae bacterium]